MAEVEIIIRGRAEWRSDEGLFIDGDPLEYLIKEHLELRDNFEVFAEQCETKLITYEQPYLEISVKKYDPLAGLDEAS